MLVLHLDTERPHVRRPVAPHEHGPEQWHPGGGRKPPSRLGLVRKLRLFQRLRSGDIDNRRRPRLGASRPIPPLLDEPVLGLVLRRQRPHPLGRQRTRDLGSGSGGGSWQQLDVRNRGRVRGNPRRAPPHRVLLQRRDVRRGPLSPQPLDRHLLQLLGAFGRWADPIRTRTPDGRRDRGRCDVRKERPRQHIRLGRRERARQQ